jgi:hypothetical protein
MTAKSRVFFTESADGINASDLRVRLSNATTLTKRQREAVIAGCLRKSIVQIEVWQRTAKGPITVLATSLGDTRLEFQISHRAKLSATKAILSQ